MARHDSLDFDSLHPYVQGVIRRGVGYPSARIARRASDEAYRVAASDAAFNQKMYQNQYGVPPAPDYGYISQAYMPKQARAEAQQYYSKLSQPAYRGPIDTYSLPSGGTVGLPATTDPEKLAMRARFGTPVGGARPSPAEAYQLGYTGQPSFKGNTPYEKSYLMGYNAPGVVLPAPPTMVEQAGQQIANTGRGIANWAMNTAFPAVDNFFSGNPGTPGNSPPSGLQAAPIPTPTPAASPTPTPTPSTTNTRQAGNPLSSIFWNKFQDAYGAYQ